MRKKKRASKKKKTIPRIAIIDHLTGLYNRRQFDKLLKNYVGSALKTKRHFALLMIDIDNFKKINDRYGHLAGDDLLKNLSKTLKASVRRVDICFRYGGDELGLILPEADAAAAENITRRLKERVEKTRFILARHAVKVGISVGLAVFPEDGQEPEALIKKADALLYRVKRQKKEKHVAPVIVGTKLAVPELKETIIDRPRLLSLLKGSLDKKLILIVADAGYGKTTLATQFIRGRELPGVFYSLEKDDSDLVVFLSYLVAGLERIRADLAARTKVLLGPGHEVNKGFEVIIGTLINELLEKLDRDLFVVLDDYHNIPGTSPVHRALDYFIDHLPGNVHVLITSRLSPELPSIARWRAKQDLLEIQRRDLCFTEEEAANLLGDVYRVVLANDELARIFEQTQGWITGIQLILQAVGRDRDRETVRQTLNGYMSQSQPLFEYFANDVLNSEPQPVQDFLRHSAILEVMTPRACDRILGIDDSRGLLASLEKHNLFVSSRGGEDYRFHPLFRSYLWNQLSDAERKDLNRRAAEYYNKEGEFESAIHHFLEAGDFENGARLINQVADQTRDAARYDTLQKWLSRLPAGIIDRYPGLLLIKGLLSENQNDHKAAELFYSQAEHEFRRTGDRSRTAEALVCQADLLWLANNCEESLQRALKALRICPASDQALRGQILMSIGLARAGLGDMKQGRLYLQKAYKHVAGLKDSTLPVRVMQNLAAFNSRQGEIRLAFNIYEPLIEHIGERYYHSVGVTFSSAAIAAAYLGKTEWAEDCLNKGLRICQPYEDNASKVMLDGGFGVLALIKKDWDGAGRFLSQALAGAQRMKWRETEIFILRYLDNLHRYTGDLDKAEEYMDQLAERIDCLESTIGILYYTDKALIQICREQYEHAAKTIKKSLSLIGRFESRLSEFTCYLGQAAAALGLGRERQAVGMLKRALELSRGKGYDGILGLELAHLPQLIELAQRFRIEEKYLLSLGVKRPDQALRLRVNLFGGLRILDKKGRPLEISWPTERTKALFALSVVHQGTPLLPESIIERLWPDTARRRAQINFRTTVSRLRRVLYNILSGQVPRTETFIIQNKKYLLNPAIRLSTDIQEFERLLDEADKADFPRRPELIERALVLYSADCLSGQEDPWIVDLREKLWRRRLNALCWLAKYRGEQGDDENCIKLCQEYLAIDPSSEDMVRLGMTGLHRLADMDRLKDFFQVWKRTLKKILDTEPSPEIKRIYNTLVGEPRE